MGRQAKNRRRWLSFVFVFILVSIACNMPGTAEQDAREQSLMETQNAIALQQTVMAISQATSAAVPADQFPTPEQAKPVEQPTYTPYPTYTVEAAPTEVVLPTEVPRMDFETWMEEEAKILVYEDMKGNFSYLPRVDQALDALGLNSANVVRVGDAQGNFLRELNTGRGWDLIIVAGESRTAPTGEFWETISDLVIQDDIALIMEVWNLDSYYIGKISPLLSRCGVTLHRDWERDPYNFDIYNYSIYWLEPQHPVFTEPNLVEPLLVSDLIWDYDVGDLLQVKGGDAEILAGTQKREHSLYGLITTCMDGRMLIQSFSTHDYPADPTLALWQNYIVYTLHNRYDLIQP